MPREGHDQLFSVTPVPVMSFQSTCPARGTTHAPLSLACGCLDLNPRAPRGARLFNIQSSSVFKDISIHVPREGHDVAYLKPVKCKSGFQSTCPARGTTNRAVLPQLRKLFQSTCPARGTTTYPSGEMLHAVYFNPRAPRGARPAVSATARRAEYFNPRAPRGARHFPGS